MALGDWSQQSNSANHVVSLDISTPLVGVGSLKIANAVGTPTAVNMYLTSLAKGFTKGRIRTLMRVAVRPSHVAHEGCGIVCLQSTLDVTAGSGDCYTFRLGPGPSATGAPGTLYWGLVKHTSAIVNAGTALDISASETVAAGDYWPTQLEWVVDIPNLGGTRLTASRGTKNSTDFSTLAVIYDYLDTASPLTTSVAEGLFGCHPTTGSTSYTYTFDETSVYELT